VLFTGCIGAAASDRVEYTTDVPDEPMSWLLFTYEGEAEFKNPPQVRQDGSGDPQPSPENGKVEMYELELNATPLLLGDEPWMLGVGTEFNWTRFDFKELPYKTEDLYIIKIPFSVIYEDEKWSVMGSVAPGVFSDLNDLTDDDFRITGYAMSYYKWNPRLKLALGAAYDRVFGRDELYPLAGVVWDVGEHLEFNLVLPYPAIIYSPSRRLLFFADARPAGSLWNVEGTDEDSDFKLEGWRLGLGLEYEIYKHIWFHLGGGASVDRKYEYREKGFDYIDSDADDAFFVRTGIVIR
jgi:hypothetical protein